MICGGHISRSYSLVYFGSKIKEELKQCFQRKTMSHQPQIELASMLTKIVISSLLCHNDTIYKERLKSINYFNLHEHKFGQNLKL